MFVGLMKLYCHGIPTANSNQTIIITATATTKDGTSLDDKQLTLKADNELESMYYNSTSEMHGNLGATKASSSMVRVGDNMPTSTTTYAQNNYITNNSIDIALTPMMR